MSEKKKSSKKGKSYTYYPIKDGAIRISDGSIEYASKDGEIRFSSSLSHVIEVFLEHIKNEKPTGSFTIE